MRRAAPVGPRSASCAQNRHALLRLGIPGELLFAARIELELPRVDDQVDSLEVGELLELAGRPLGLHRTAADDEVDVADAARPEPRERFVGDVGRGQIFRIPPENASHIDRDVARADDRGGGAREIDRQVGKVGVSAVPGDQGRRRVAAREVLARYSEPPVALPTHREDDLIVVRREVGHREISAQFDVAEKADPRIERHALEDPDDLLDLRMIGRHAETHQTVGRRQAIEEVDPQIVLEAAIGSRALLCARSAAAV